MKLYVLVFMLLVFNSVRFQEKTLHKTTIFESIEDYEKGGEIYFEKILIWKQISHIVLVMEFEGNKIKVRCYEVYRFDMKGIVQNYLKRVSLLG